MEKVLIVIPQMGTGGAEKLIVNLLENFDYRKIDLHLMILYNFCNENNFEQRIKKLPVHIYTLNKKRGIDLFAIFKAKKIISKIKPKIINTHLDSITTMLLSFNKKQIIFHTVHNIAENEAGGFQYFLRKLCLRIFNFKFIAISDLIQKSISAYYKIKSSEIKIIYNGINTNEFKCIREKNNKIDKINIISVGSLKHQKNYFEMIEIIKCLKNNSFDINLTILGDGVLKEQIQEKIKELNLNNFITLIGNVNNVQQYLSKADIYLSTSLYEGLPLSILEAMASGLPIISSRVGGVPDIVINGENGFLYELGNINDCVKSISTLINDYDLRYQMGQNSKERSKIYDSKSCARKYENLYIKGK